MKQILTLGLATITLLLFACQPKATETTNVAKPKHFEFTPLDSIQIDTDSLKLAGEMIPVDTAQQWIENYQQYMSTLYKKNEAGEMVPLDQTEILNGFTYRTEDLLAVLGIEKNKLANNVPHIRGYFGLTSNTSPFSFKLLLLAAVDASLDKGALSAGKDAYFVAKKKNGLQGTEENGGFVLDLNYPCPTLCPDDGNGIRKN